MVLSLLFYFISSFFLQTVRFSFIGDIPLFEEFKLLASDHFKLDSSQEFGSFSVQHIGAAVEARPLCSDEDVKMLAPNDIVVAEGAPSPCLEQIRL